MKPGVRVVRKEGWWDNAKQFMKQETHFNPITEIALEKKVPKRYSIQFDKKHF